MSICKYITYFSALSILALVLALLLPKMLGEQMNRMYELRAIFYCLGCPALSFFISVKSPRHDNPGILSWIISIIFSQFISIGSSIYLDNQFFLSITDHPELLFWLGKTLVWTLILAPIVAFVINWLQSYRIKQSSGLVSYRQSLFWTIIPRIVCLGLFFPCIFDFDSGFGLRTMLDESEVQTNHHPYLVQFIHYLFYRLGDILGNPSIGFALLSCGFIGVSSAIIVYAARRVDSLTGNAQLTKIFGYTLALFPLFPLLSVYCTKDGFFTYFFLLFEACLMELYISKGKCFGNTRFCIIFSLAILLLSATRHQGIYIVGFQAICMLFVYRKKLIAVLLTMFIPIIVVLCFNCIILPHFDVEQTNKKESYNMLFQQTARCLKEFPTDITPFEMTAISRILNIDSIRGAYQYRITDNVKSFYKYSEGDVTRNDGLLHFRRVDHTGEDEALSEYRKAWVSMLLRHPEAYSDASLCVVTGFFFNTGLNLFTFDTSWQDSMATTPDYGFKQVEFFSKALSNVNGYLSNLPLTDLLAGLPFYNWICILLLLVILWRKDIAGLATFLPVILSMGVLIMCPVASGRYEYPIIIAIPLMIVYTIKTNRENINSSAL